MRWEAGVGTLFSPLYAADHDAEIRHHQKPVAVGVPVRHIDQLRHALFLPGIGNGLRNFTRRLRHTEEGRFLHGPKPLLVKGGRTLDPVERFEFGCGIQFPLGPQKSGKVLLVKRLVFGDELAFLPVPGIACDGDDAAKLQSASGLGIKFWAIEPMQRLTDEN